MTSPVRIAVVEDAGELRSQLARCLEARPGWRVVAGCGSIAEARARLPSALPDLVLLDLRLPDGSGADLIPWLRPVLPGATVVMLTVVEDPPEIVRAIQLGARGYLLKRDAGNLQLHVGEILSGGSPVMSPSVARHLWEWARNGPLPAGSQEMPGLTPREQEVLRLMARGHSEETIARELGIALNTVKVHRRHLYDKLGVHSRVEAVLKMRDAWDRSQQAGRG
jgi:DNA-binding NarL/FixJ family response regulator